MLCSPHCLPRSLKLKMFENLQKMLTAAIGLHERNHRFKNMQQKLTDIEVWNQVMQLLQHIPS